MYRKRRHESELFKPGEFGPDDVKVLETREGLDVEFKLHVLADILTCPLCEGFFCDATTIKECLHTFCRSCICKFINEGGRACPSCSEDLGVQPLEAIAYDRTVQNLVDKLVPQYAATELKQRRELAAFCGLEDPTLAAAPSAPAPLGPAGAAPRGAEEKDTEKKVVDANEAEEALDGLEEFHKNAKQASHARAFANDITFSVHPADSSLPSLDKPFLRATSQMPVSCVQKFIFLKLPRDLGIADPSEIDVVWGGQVLPRTHTLEFVCRLRRVDYTKWSCLELKYRRLPHGPPEA